MNEITSEYRNKKYQTTGSIRVLNQKQAAFYWSNGVEPLDIYLSKSFETGEPRIVYVFSREDTKELYERWLASNKEASNGIKRN